MVVSGEAAPSQQPSDFPFHKAAFNGDLEQLRKLVEEEKRTNRKLPVVNGSQNTPLHAAARTGKTEVITYVCRRPLLTKERFWLKKKQHFTTKEQIPCTNLFSVLVLYL